MDEKRTHGTLPATEAAVPDKDVRSFEETIDREAEKRVLRKVDLNLLSVFGALYLMSFLGRSALFVHRSRKLTLSLRSIQHWECQLVNTTLRVNIYDSLHTEAATGLVSARTSS